MILKLNVLYYYFLQSTTYILYLFIKLICTLSINRNMSIILHDPKFFDNKRVFYCFQTYLKMLQFFLMYVKTVE